MPKKGEKMQKVLDFIGDRAVDILDIIEIQLTSPYNASKFRYASEQRERERKKQRLERDLRRQSERQIRKYVSKLKCDGLIKNSEGKFCLTNKGKTKREELNRKKSKDYEIKKSRNLIVVSFDIPKLFDQERDWLREILKILDFEMRHQSLWVGENKIPEELISDMEEKKILEFVDIFEVKRCGTLIDFLEKKNKNKNKK